jgi:hypothetical protein
MAIEELNSEKRSDIHLYLETQVLGLCVLGKKVYSRCKGTEKST